MTSGGLGGNARWLVFVTVLVAAFALGPAAASALPLTIEGTPGPDVIRIDSTSPVSGTYSVNGVSQVFAGATSVTVNAGDGSDRVVIANGAGTLFAPPLGVFVNGGNGYDIVSDEGGLAVSGSFGHDPSDPPNTTTITHVGVPVQRIVLDSVDAVSPDSVSEDTWTYRGSPGPDSIYLEDVPSATRVGTQRIRATSGSVDYQNKTKIAIDTTDSSVDTVNLSGGHPPATSLTVTDGSTPPQDVVAVNGYQPTEVRDHGLVTDIAIRAARLESYSSYTDFEATSLALDVGQITHPGGSDATPLRTVLDKLEVQAADDIRVENSLSLQVGGLSDSLGGVRSTAGIASVVASGEYSKLSVLAGEQVSGSDVTLEAGQLDLAGSATATGPGTATLRSSAGEYGSLRAVNLGSTTDSFDSFDVSDAELDRVSAARIEVGRSDSGPFTVSAPITVAHPTALDLVSGSGFTGAGGGSVDAGAVSFADGSSTGRSWTVDPAGVKVDGGTAIPYGAPSTLSVKGGSGPDSFAVRANPQVTYAIDGGDPSSSPGDTLAYDAEGRTASGDTTPPDGAIESPGVQPVGFGSIEAVSICCTP